jgi:hypothetical protein
VIISVLRFVNEHVYSRIFGNQIRPLLNLAEFGLPFVNGLFGSEASGL